MAEVTLIDALTMAMAWEMEHDDRVVVLGEDVSASMAVFFVPLPGCKKIRRRESAGHAFGRGHDCWRLHRTGSPGNVAGCRNPVYGLYLPDGRSNYQSCRPNAESNARSVDMPDGATRALRRWYPRTRAPFGKYRALFAHMPGVRVVIPSSPTVPMVYCWPLFATRIRSSSWNRNESTDLNKQEVEDNGKALPMDVCYILKRRELMSRWLPGVR